MKKSMQVGEWRILASADAATEDVDALLAHVTGWNPTQLMMRRDAELDDAQLEQLTECLSRRLNGEPVAYITGSRGFWTLELGVNEHTLIPRADTETMVEAVLDRVNRQAALEILDLGTGSGAIALALAKELPHAHVTATDFSEGALHVARDNAERNAIANVQFRQGDWFDALQRDATFDVIVSNPPYIAEGDAHLSEGDLRFEPATALSSGADGLNDIRHIVANVGRFLRQKGWFFVEHGFDQGERVRALLQGIGLTGVATLKDYGSNDRVTFGQLP